jgi:hypothetical protein
MDFRVFDLRDEFTLEEASLAWTGMERADGYGIGPSEVVFKTLQLAAESGELPVSRVLYEKDGELFGSPVEDQTNWRMSIISRTELVKFAEKRGQRPKFLFPEQRNIDEGLPRVEDARKLRPSQVDKAVVQAIGRMLWDENPKLMIEGLAKLPAIKEYGNGRHYQESTVRSWLAEVDPRDSNKKKGPTPERK